VEKPAYCTFTNLRVPIILQAANEEGGGNDRARDGIMPSTRSSNLDRGEETPGTTGRTKPTDKEKPVLLHFIKGFSTSKKVWFIRQPTTYSDVSTDQKKEARIAGRETR